MAGGRTAKFASLPRCAWAIAIALGLGLATSSCGGGGGAPAPTVAPPPPPFVPTAEDTGTPQLKLINALAAFARGYFGANATVAVVDTGVFASHVELQGRVLQGYDALSTPAGGTDTSDPDGHGTAVAGVIAAARNGTAPTGIAPQARILPVRLLSASGSTLVNDNVEAGAINFIRTSGVRIANYSFNTDDTITDLGPNPTGQIQAMHPASLNAWANFVAAGGVNVWAAGNSADPEPEYLAALPQLFPQLEPGWLAVVSVDVNGVISTFSNRCGPTAAFCLAAPGENVLTLDNVNSTPGVSGFVTGAGTSFAAPAVSAAIAVLISAFPNLTPQQAVDILLQTANRTGIYADPAIYGQGLLDLGKATQPVGTLSISTAGQSVPVQATSVNVSSAFGNGLVVSLQDFGVLAQDDFERAYVVPAASLVRNAILDFAFENRIAHFAQQEHMSSTPEAAISIGLASEDGRYRSTQDEPYWMAVTLPLAPQLVASASINGGSLLTPGLVAQETRALDRELLKPGIMSDPYVALMDLPSRAAFSLLRGRSALTFGFSIGDAYIANDRLLDVRSRKEHAMVASNIDVTTMLSHNLTVQFGAGMLHEQSTLLGAFGTGATGFSDAATYYAHMGGSLRLSAKFTLTGAIHYGVTNSSGSDSSLIDRISTVVTNAYGVGLTGRNVFRPGDRLSFGAGQPLRAVRGVALFDLPAGIDQRGMVSRQRLRIPLAADGREIDVQGSYALPLGARTDVALGVLLREDPDNIRGAKRDVVGAVRIGRYW